MGVFAGALIDGYLALQGTIHFRAARVSRSRKLLAREGTGPLLSGDVGRLLKRGAAEGDPSPIAFVSVLPAQTKSDKLVSSLVRTRLCVESLFRTMFVTFWGHFCDVQGEGNLRAKGPESNATPP